ncbi:MAG: hypothetical protein ACRD8Z_26875, partial [Nitrososphaeraceae archaeon]
PVALLSVLLTLVSFSSIHNSFFQLSFATQEEEGVRTLGIKVYLEKSVVAHGKEQTINFHVADQNSDQPIGGAITSATVSYADGQTVRQFSEPTDESGRSSISWTIERDAPEGLYEVVYSVFQTGYVPESFVSSFTVLAYNVAYGCLSSSSSSVYSSSLVPEEAGSSTHIGRSQTSQLCD